MKYYLETNALRALGNKIHENQNIISKSFTSIFAIFEIIKGINFSKDSKKRINIIKNLVNSNIKIIGFMPIEVIENIFLTQVDISESNNIIQELKKIISNPSEYKGTDEYLKLIRRYENGTNIFKKKITQNYCIPKPETETIEITFDDLFSEPEIPSELSEKIAKLPKNTHPSEILLLMIRDKYIISLYKMLNISDSIDKDDILKIYNRELDLFFFALYMFDLKKKSLREAPAKNDFLDLLHIVYLNNTEMIIVSNDKIFKTILPNKNVISVEEYLT